MTLNLTIVNQWGIWQASDHRLTHPGSGRTLDESSVKHVQLNCVDGTALIVYCGAGRIGSVTISDWIVETLRGEQRTVDSSLVLLRENATKDIAPHMLHVGLPHMFSIGAFVRGQRWVAQIRNFPYKGGVQGPVSDSFVTIARNFSDQPGQGFWFGTPGLVSKSQESKLMSIARRKPRHPEEFEKLLAKFIATAAKTSVGRRTISASCVTSFITPDGSPGHSTFHGEKGVHGNKPMVIPSLLFGIDVTPMLRGVLSNVLHMKNGAPTPPVESAGRAAVAPRNRLRPGADPEK